MYHWIGEGEAGQHEWVFRMYNEHTTDIPPRPNRISFYVFNPAGGEGIGSYFQEPVQAGEWIHVVGMADEEKTSIFKNGEFKKCDRYTGTGPGPCHNYPPDLWITPMRRDCAAADRNPRSRELLPWSHRRSQDLEPRVDGDGGRRAL
jgi:hypothetical protein